MRDLLDALARWAASGSHAALARIVSADGPSGHRAGAAVAIDEHGEVAGNPAGRYPEAAAVVVSLDADGLRSLGPLGPRDAVCVMVEDADRQAAALAAARATRAGHVVAMGPPNGGSPSRSPEDAAVAVCAEIAASRDGGTPPPPAPSFR